MFLLIIFLYCILFVLEISLVCDAKFRAQLSLEFFSIRMPSPDHFDVNDVKSYVGMWCLIFVDNFSFSLFKIVDFLITFTVDVCLNLESLQE